MSVSILAAYWNFGTSSVDGFFACYFFFAAPLFFVMEGFQIVNFGYSKFAEKSQDRTPMVPSRIGMTLIYLPAMLAFPVLTLLYGFGVNAGSDDVYHIAIGGMIFAHFTKRVLESLFLHKYSGSTRLGTTLTVSTLYTVMAFMFYRSSLRVEDASCGFLCLSKPQYRSQPLLVIGVSVWLIGTVGNFYHHWLLMRLRSNSNAEEKFKYRVPRGGLFGLVCCPHYFTELVSWAGVVMATGHVTGLCVLWVMVFYLSGRAHSTLRWYKEKANSLTPTLDADLPRGWCRIFPFIF